MNRIEEAISYALKMHAGQARKASPIPYIMHPMEAGVIAASLTDDEDTIIAAILHDTVEDTPATLEDLRTRFGDRVAEIVAAETENKRDDRPKSETWQIRKEESLAEFRTVTDPAIRIVWLSDKLSNVRSLYRNYLVEGDRAFSHFNMKDKARHGWYYHSIVDILSDMSDRSAWRELKAMVDAIFDK